MACLLGKARATPHMRIAEADKLRRPPLIGLDFMFLKSDCTLQLEAVNAWAITLVGVDEGTQRCIAVTMDEKGDLTSSHTTKRFTG